MRIGLAIVLALSLTPAPLGTTAAQSPEKAARVGYLYPGSSSDPTTQRRLEVFRQSVRELGYVDGQNIVIESRFAEGQYDRYPALLADLVRLKVDVLVTQSGEATKAAQAATKTIPIVMSMVMDPVGSGIVSSLARPGGNVTGTSYMAPDLVGKQLEVLKEVVPKLSRVALLRHPTNPASAVYSREAEAAAWIFGGAASNPGRAECPGDRQGLRGDDQAASGGASDFPGRVIRNSTKTDSRTRGEEPPPSDTRGDAGLRGGGRFHGL